MGITTWPSSPSINLPTSATSPRCLIIDTLKKETQRDLTRRCLLACFERIKKRGIISLVWFFLYVKVTPYVTARESG